MTTLALFLFLAADGYTDALLWPRLRKTASRPGWGSTAYQLARFAAIRLPLLACVYSLAGSTGHGALAVAFALVLVWAAPMDTLYHWFGAEGPFGQIPIDGDDHDHKGPIVPAVASDLVGVESMSEAEYRTASVAAGLAILACALCIDVVALLTLA